MCSDTRASGTASIAIGLHVQHEDVAQLDWCLAHVRRAYPTVPLVVIGDAPGRDYRACCARHKVTYHAGTRLKVLERGGMWWGRFFSLLLPYQTITLVKIDPDTKIRRPFRLPFPDAEVFGSYLAQGTPIAHIQGGCHMFSRSGVVAMMKAGSFAWPELCDPKIWAPAPMYERVARARFLSSDFTMMYITRRLGFRIANYPDVYSRWEENLEGLALDVAVSHPHKLFDRSKMTLPPPARTPVT